MLRKRVWIPILILLLVAMGCGLFYGRKAAKQEPVKVYKPVEVEKPAPQKPPPPGETAESGHWHGDVWHSTRKPEPPEVSGGHAAPPPAQQSAAEETPDAPQAPTQLPADFVNPTSISTNPLFADGVPEHLQCPPEWIGAYLRDISTEDLERTHQIGFELIEKWNPNRPLTEVWSAFMEAEKWYHDNADPERAGISVGAGRSDWQWQNYIDFPEIIVLALEDTDRFFNMRMVELGVYEPDHNMFELADGSGRTFRTDNDKKYVFTWSNYTEKEDGGFTSNTFKHTSGPGNGDPNAEVIHINLDEVTDEELERLSGWNYNINPYTTGAYKLGDHR